MAIKPFEDFVLHDTPDPAVIEKYTDVLPHAVINIWKDYGFGSFAKGFLKTINPDEYQELLNETYMKKTQPIPVFTTGLGDIIVWDKFVTADGVYNCFEIVFYRDGDTMFLCEVNDLDEDDFFTDNLTDSDTYKNEFFWGAYLEAVKIQRTTPAYDECYGYAPLLGLGGAEQVQNLQIVKIKEYITLIKEMVGNVSPRE
ncbi:MAG: DUF1851 domain-containing protein [Defluviitaleaceae bacterium]|nr:DUF1851 domain-containing protein [Defluviitaleaceae bacterium]